jgi:nucleoside 2-deoxyribosyltransferase
MTILACPVCLNKYSDQSRITNGHGGSRIECEICGRFSLSDEVWEDFLDPQSGAGSKLTEVQRSRLAHKLRTAVASESIKWPKLDYDFLSRFRSEGFPGPNMAEQAKNLIRFVGEEISKTGLKIESCPKHLFATIGSPNPIFASNLAIELIQSGLLTGEDLGDEEDPYPIDLGLTLRGWENFESEKSGKFAGNYGFIAMKFGDSILDPFVQNEVKPAIKTGIGYDLVDVRDVAQAGIIDNIMRAQIRDSAFVLVDLTHDNSGAYWEAGYAEGLGKPVIYLCESSKFEKAKTHFDTNHCTTVIWSINEVEKFKTELIATLRRSLNLFG